jgi:hypothetical protein
MYLIQGMYGIWIQETDELLVMRSGLLSLSHVRAVVRGLIDPSCSVKELSDRMIQELRELDRGVLKMHDADHE